MKNKSSTKLSKYKNIAVDGLKSVRMAIEQEHDVYTSYSVRVSTMDKKAFCSTDSNTVIK